MRINEILTNRCFLDTSDFLNSLQRIRKNELNGLAQVLFDCFIFSTRPNFVISAKIFEHNLAFKFSESHFDCFKLTLVYLITRELTQRAEMESCFKIGIRFECLSL